MSKMTKPDVSKRHKQAGKNLMVQHGELKGTAVKVIDFIAFQFQGKSLKSLKDRPDLSPEIDALKGRGFELSETTVFASVPETPPRYILLDDSELQMEATKPNLKLAKELEFDADTETLNEVPEGHGAAVKKKLGIIEHDPELHSHGQEVEDDSGTTVEGNIEGAGVLGGAEGRTVLSEASDPKDEAGPSIEGQSDSQVGSGPGPSTEPVTRPDKPKADSGKPAKSGPRSNPKGSK